MVTHTFDEDGFCTICGRSASEAEGTDCVADASTLSETLRLADATDFLPDQLDSDLLAHELED